MGWYFYVVLFSFNAVRLPLSGFYGSLKGSGPQVGNILLWKMDLYFLGGQISFADIIPPSLPDLLLATVSPSLLPGE